MYLVDNSITVVLLGDWSNLYTQPDWIAKNIYESPEIEIGIEGNNTVFSVSYRKNSVTIKPSQSKIVFSVANCSSDTLEYLAGCVNNYVKKATTPMLGDYGINAEYNDLEDVHIADVFDRMEDANELLDLGYEIGTTQVSRSLFKDMKNLNMKCDISSTKTTISFNEHHANPEGAQFEITTDMLNEFLSQTKEIIVKLGYVIDGE